MSKKKTKAPTLYTPVGTASYPKLTKPDRYEGKGDPKYKVKLILEPNAATEKFKAQAEAYFEEQLEKYLAENPKFKKTHQVKYPALRDQVDDEGELTGNYEVNASMNAQFEDKETGKIVKMRPEIRDSKNKLCRPASIWGGSKLRLAIRPFFHAKGAEITYSWRLIAVQIIELVQGGSGADFGEAEGGWTADDEDDGSDGFSSNESDDSNDDDNDDEEF